MSTKSYNSYVEAAMINRAFAARKESNHLFCLENTDMIEDSIKALYNGEKYINPAAMSIILDCDMFELMNAVKAHKEYINNMPTTTNIKLSMLGTYGNHNLEVHADYKVKLQAWINFLTLDCFGNSPEASVTVKKLNELK